MCWRGECQSPVSLEAPEDVDTSHQGVAPPLGESREACIPLGTDSACSGHPFSSFKVGFTARTQGACSQRRCGERLHVKLQSVSSEDCRTPVRGHSAKQNAEIRSAFFATAQMLIFHFFNSVHPFSCRGHGVRDSRNLGKSVVRLFVSSSSESHVSGCRNDHWCRVWASSS